MLITPEQAKSLLQGNRGNRHLQKHYVERLAMAMRNGEWRKSHQAIAIAPDGRLLDGQHRCSAIVQAGVAVPMLVAFDCDPETFEIIDVGRKRDNADALGESREAVALASLISRLVNGSSGTPSDFQPTTTQIREVLAWAKPPIELVGNACLRRIKNRTSAPIRLGVVLRVMNGQGKDAIPLYRAFVDMEMAAFTPALASFFKQVMDGHISSRKHAWDLAVRAWKAFDPNSTVTRLLGAKVMAVPLEEMKSVADKFCREAKGRRLKAVA